MGFTLDSARRETGVGQYMTAEEIELLGDMVAELRELTRSKTTFRRASQFLARIGRDDGTSRMVGDDADGR